MTREEAIQKARELCASSWSEREMADIIDLMAALGILKFDTPEESMRIAAINRLDGMFVMTTAAGALDSTATGAVRRLSTEGAVAVIDILTKSGFKITR